MYKDFLNTNCKIIGLTLSNNDGLSKSIKTVKEISKCRLSIPNGKDLKLIDHIKDIGKKVLKLYLSSEVIISESDEIEITGKNYKIIYKYDVYGANELHHIKCLVVTI